MRISGAEPSSVNCRIKSWKVHDAQKVQKQTKAKKRWCNKPTQLQFQSILTLSELYESTKVDRRTWLHVSSLVHSPSSWNIKRDFY